MYGISLNNEQGVSMIGANEFCLFYLGKKIINHTNGTADYVTLRNTMAHGEHYYRGYFTCETPNPNNPNAISGPGGAGFMVGIFDNTTYFYIDRAVPTSTFTLYLFGTIKDIPKLGYGLNIYNADGSLQFTSSRPLFSARELIPFSITDKYPTAGGKYDPNFTAPHLCNYKPAVQCGMSNSYVEIGTRKYINTDITAYTNGSNWYVGFSRLYDGGSGSSLIDPPDVNFNLPIIDAGFYDQFSTMPNLFV